MSFEVLADIKVSTSKPCLEQMLKDAGTISNKRRAYRRFHILQLNHIRRNNSGLYEVLVPFENNVYAIKTFPNLDDASKEALAIKNPINFNSFINTNTFGHLDVISDLKSKLDSFGIPYYFEHRIKDPLKARDKLFARIKSSKTQTYDLKDINDLLGTRIVVETNLQKVIIFREIKRIYENKKTIDGNKRIIVFRNYHDHLKPSGYNAFNISYIGKNGRPIEVQITTRRMIAWDKWDHDRIYKSNYSKDDSYFLNLKKYGRAIADYIRLKDNGKSPRYIPSFQSYGLKPEHAFDFDSIK